MTCWISVDRAILKTYLYTGVRLATAYRLRVKDLIRTVSRPPSPTTRKATSTALPTTGNLSRLASNNADDSGSWGRCDRNRVIPVPTVNVRVARISEYHAIGLNPRWIPLLRSLISSLHP